MRCASHADRMELQAILDQAPAAAEGCGEVVVPAGKGYVSLMMPRRKFATVVVPT
jgi:hypothetical protein